MKTAASNLEHEEKGRSSNRRAQRGEASNDGGGGGGEGQLGDEDHVHELAAPPSRDGGDGGVLLGPHLLHCPCKVLQLPSQHSHPTSRTVKSSVAKNRDGKMGF